MTLLSVSALRLSRTSIIAAMVLSTTLTPTSSGESPTCTWLCATGTVPVTPEASFSLKSARPWQPMVRQKRITVGWLTLARRAISEIGSLITARGCARIRLATRSSAGENRGNADESRVGRCDDVGRDLLHVGVETPFAFEAGAKGRLCKVVAQMRHHAAADIDTTQCAQCDGDVGRQRAEYAAEAIDHFQAQRIFLVQCAVDDLRRRQFFGVLDLVAYFINFAQRAVNHFQAGAGDQAFSRDVLISAPAILQDRRFFFIGRRERDVTALATQGNPAAFARDQAANAQAGAGADQADHAAFQSLSAADLYAVRLFQMR